MLYNIMLYTLIHTHTTHNTQVPGGAGGVPRGSTVRRQVHTHIHIHIYIYILTYIHTHTHTYTYIHTYTSTPSYTHIQDQKATA
jgi:hypothetical protein